MWFCLASFRNKQELTHINSRTAPAGWPSAEYHRGEYIRYCQAFTPKRNEKVGVTVGDGLMLSLSFRPTSFDLTQPEKLIFSPFATLYVIHTIPMEQQYYIIKLWGKCVRSLVSPFPWRAASRQSSSPSLSSTHPGCTGSAPDRLY